MAANRVPDPIRIVPLRTEAIAPTGTPQLTYRGGPLIASVQVFLIFWGDAWRQDPLAALAQQLNDFFAYIVTSPLIDEMSEYSVPNFTISQGSRTGAINLTTPVPPSVADADLQALIQQEIASDPAIAQPTPNTLYFVFLPPGTTASLNGGTSCMNFCGYHNDIGGNIFYAVEPYPDCGGCTSGLSVFDALTVTSSHELCEAITDPIPGQGWYSDDNGEIGDICAWQTKKLGPYTVQLEWSTNTGGCA
jgi:hypothetical protein